MKKQKQYEAVRAFALDNLSAQQVADKFGYRLSSVYTFIKKTRLGEMGFSPRQKMGPGLKIFAVYGKANSNNVKFQFWQQDNHPIELNSNKEIEMRLNYMHENPVEQGFTNLAECYDWSSAIDYSGGKGLVEIEMLSTITFALPKAFGMLQTRMFAIENRTGAT